MEKATSLSLVTIVVYLFIHGSCAACSFASNEAVNTVVGEDVTLSCTHRARCKKIHWSAQSHLYNGFVSNSNHFMLYSSGHKSHLGISNITLGDAGFYKCFCYRSGYQGGKLELDCFTLTTICHAKVLMDGEKILYNSSSSNPNVLSVSMDTFINIECPEGRTPERNCSNVPQTESGMNTYYFKVKKNHDRCSIECKVRSQPDDVVICSIIWILHVSVPSENTTTPSPDKDNTPSSRITMSSAKLGTKNAFITISNTLGTDQSGSFPVISVLSVVIAILVGVILVECLYIYYSRSKSNKAINPATITTDAHIPIGPSYTIVNKNSAESLQEHVDSVEQGVSGTDGFYFEINRSNNVDQTTPLAGSTEVQCSITNDYYSEVNISNDQLGLNIAAGVTGGNCVYDEVEIDAKQTQNKWSSSPPNANCNQDVSTAQADQLPNQSRSSNKEVRDSEKALYTVVFRKNMNK